MFEFFLNYPKMVFEQGEVIFAREWPIWIAFTVFVSVALIITGIIIFKRKALAFWQLAVIWVLQLGMIAVLLGIIWQPAIVTEQLRAGDNVVALMLDTSGSMNYSEGDATRMQQALSVVNGDAIDKLGDQYSVQRFLFSGDAGMVETFEPLPPPATTTRLGDSVLQVLGMSRTTALGAVVVVSDGADNAGALTQDQLAEISAYGVPVHTIGIGRDRIAEDLELQEVTMPGQTLPGTVLSARVAVRHDDAGIARIKVYDGENLVTTQEIPLQPDTNVTTAWIDVPVSAAGYRALKFSLDPRPGEQIMENNTRTRVVEVKEEKYRILYIEGEPRWEYKFIRRAMDKDPSVELVSLLRVSQNKFYRQGIDTPDELEAGFPLGKADLFKYHALLIGSIEAPVFTAEQQAMIRDFVSERGGSLLMLAGPNGLGKGAWGNSLINEVLPAKIPASDSKFVRKQVRVVLTPAGLHTAMLKLNEDPVENNRLWKELPEIADYQTIGALRPATTSLVNIVVDGKQQPLLVTQPYGKGQSYILATGGTWRWQMQLPVKDQSHETFWRQVLRELVINSPTRFRLSTQVIADTVKIRAEILDDTFMPERDLRLTAIISPESGEAMTMDLHPSTEYPGLLAGEFVADRSGLYTIEAISRRNDEPVDSMRIAVHHDSGKSEFYSLRRNQSLLDQLAAATGGRNWSAEDIDELAEAIRYSPAGITERNIRPLWDAPAIFLLLLILKSMEWLLRRRWRTI